MVPSSTTKILIGISLDSDQSKALLSWAVGVLARPGDTVIAVHVVVPKTDKNSSVRRKEVTNKWQSTRKYQKQIRQAKSYVISIMGELVKTSLSKEINLEARVGFNSSAGRGLIEETKSIAADYLLIGGKRNQSNRSETSSIFTKIFKKKISRIPFSLFAIRPPRTISKYCFQNVPKGCSLIMLDPTKCQQQHFHSKSRRNQEFDQEVNTKSAEKSNYIENSFSSDKNEFYSKRKCENPSPTTVLDVCEGESQSTEEDCSSLAESCITNNFSSSGSLESKRKPQIGKPMRILKQISYFFRSPVYWPGGNRNGSSLKGKHQALLRCFTYQQIANATNNFHAENLVGQGGYSDVYKGELDNGCSIAVKRLTKDNTNANKEKEFLMELGIIGHINHPNTAQLVGCCIENGLYLIFKFYPNGTLSSALHGQSCNSLDWPIRYRIALGVARGLHYLHKCCKHRIIHRDIKASNVLLAPDYEPQISDFGLAKWLPNKWTHHAVIPIEGTFGYLAPEYFMHGIVDEKIDVFAFGVLLLEIVTGRKPVDSKQSLLLWARPIMESGNLTQLADPKLEGKYDMDQLHRVVLTASYCVRQSSIWRPSMTEVIQLLTYGQDSELVKSLRIPKFTSDEMDDYSMVFGYQLPSDLSLEDI
ncbi:probable receptor-like serine threonine- kinase At5g57670 isoform X1 [Olea europaea subsp. europaea]|nr:probable receptor-like serine threonine- kinase At5g57670 isoform X1 [Olea europaea subsp. europaea]